MVDKLCCDVCGQMTEPHKDGLLRRANQLLWSVTNYPCSMSPECCEEIKQLVSELERVCK